MVTPETLTDEMVLAERDTADIDLANEVRWWRDHRQLWTVSGQHNHDRRVRQLREVIAICASALNPQCHETRLREARQRICDFINAREVP